MSVEDQAVSVSILSSEDSLGAHEFDLIDRARAYDFGDGIEGCTVGKFAAHGLIIDPEVEKDMGAAGRVAAPRLDRLKYRLSGEFGGLYGGKPGAVGITLTALAVVP